MLRLMFRFGIDGWVETWIPTLSWETNQSHWYFIRCIKNRSGLKQLQLLVICYNLLYLLSNWIWKDEFFNNGTRNTSPYLSLMDAIGDLIWSLLCIGLSSSDFANGYCIFSFKPSSSMSINGSRYADLPLTAAFR